MVDGIAAHSVPGINEKRVPLLFQLEFIPQHKMTCAKLHPHFLPSQFHVLNLGAPMGMSAAVQLFPPASVSREPQASSSASKPEQIKSSAKLSCQDQRNRPIQLVSRMVSLGNAHPCEHMALSRGLNIFNSNHHGRKDHFRKH